MQIFGRLDATYISFMGVLLGAIIGHHAVASRGSVSEATSRQIADLANRHLPHVHNALNSISDKLNGGK